MLLPLPSTSRSRAAVARRAHNPKVGGSIPPFATKDLGLRSFLFIGGVAEVLNIWALLDGAAVGTKQPF